MDADLAQYGLPPMDHVNVAVRQIEPAAVTVAAWAPLKCQFGCDRFGMTYACPPYTPTPAQTREVLAGYRRALLFHFEMPFTEPGTRQQYLAIYRKVHHEMVQLEETLFKNGYYKAFVFLFGGCMICDRCAARDAEPCRDREHLRPCMESSGIDVYRTARDNGFGIDPLKTRQETRNHYCLLLVD